MLFCEKHFKILREDCIASTYKRGDKNANLWRGMDVIGRNIFYLLFLGSIDYEKHNK